MELNFCENLNKSVEKTLDQEDKDVNISEIELELAKKLDAVQYFTVDRFEENYVVLENRDTKEMINVKRNDLPKEIKEGSILKCINQKYSIDEKMDKETENRIKNKMNDLWN